MNFLEFLFLEVFFFFYEGLAKFSGLNELKDTNIKEIQCLELNKTSNSEFPTKSVDKKGACSKKLASILKKETCSGEFCEYFFGNYEKGGLEELESSTVKFKELSSLIHDNNEISHEISSNLISRTKEFASNLSSVFKKFNIKSKEIDDKIQMKKALILHKKEYKMVKVCNNCYLIYSLLLKEFKQKEDKLFPNQTLHNELLYKRSQKQSYSQYLKTEPSPQTNPKNLKISINTINSNKLKNSNNSINSINLKNSSINSTNFKNSLKSIGNLSLGLGFPLKKGFFYPKAKLELEEKEPKNLLNKTFNLYKNTILTRKGEVSLNSMLLDRNISDLGTGLLRIATRDSLFGNPKQRKSFLYAVRIFLHFHQISYFCIFL